MEHERRLVDDAAHHCLERHAVAVQHAAQLVGVVWWHLPASEGDGRLLEDLVAGIVAGLGAWAASGE